MDQEEDLVYRAKSVRGVTLRQEEIKNLFRGLPSIVGRWLPGNAEPACCFETHPDVSSLDQCSHCRPFGQKILLTPKWQVKSRTPRIDGFSNYPLEIRTDEQSSQNVGLGISKGYKVKTLMKMLGRFFSNPISCILSAVRNMSDKELVGAADLAEDGLGHYLKVAKSLQGPDDVLEIDDSDDVVEIATENAEAEVEPQCKSDDMWESLAVSDNEMADICTATNQDCEEGIGGDAEVIFDNNDAKVVEEKKIEKSLQAQMEQIKQLEFELSRLHSAAKTPETSQPPNVQQQQQHQTESEQYTQGRRPRSLSLNKSQAPKKLVSILPNIALAPVNASTSQFARYGVDVGSQKLEKVMIGKDVKNKFSNNFKQAIPLITPKPALKRALFAGKENVREGESTNVVDISNLATPKRQIGRINASKMGALELPNAPQKKKVRF